MESSNSFSPNNSSSSNALSLRVSKVLATSQFDDPNTKIALDTLNNLSIDYQHDLNLSSSNNLSLSNSNEFDHLDCLKRGGLRRIVEQRIRSRSREFLNVFSDLNEKLVELQANLDQMHECCQEAQNKLTTANLATKYLLEHADGLRKESQDVATKQLIAKAFLHRFTLTDLETQALLSRDVQADRNLFLALDHCEQIRSDCATLLSGDLNSGQAETAGLDIMQATSKYLDKGYEKVMRWTLFEFRTGLVKGSEGQPEVSQLMKRAIDRLKRRPELFDEAINLLSTARSTSLLNLFFDALTRGGPSGLPRPIELNAHDPIRYVGDILAWVHQIMASEHEFLESLFDLKSDGRRVGESRVFQTTGISSQEEQTLKDSQSTSDLTITNSQLNDRDRVRILLDKHLEGCTRPLKIRVRQTIKSQEGSLVACQLASLLEFYKLTMANTIGPHADLTKALIELTAEAYEIFYQLLRSLSTYYLNHLEPPPVDLSVPAHLHEAMSNLREIMVIYEGSSEENSTEYSFERVLELVIDPMLQVVEQTAKLRASEWDQSLFWVNCLEAMLMNLNAFNFTKTATQKLEEYLETYLSKLTQLHYTYLLNSSGLESVLNALETKDDNTPLSRLEEANSKSISQAVQTFDVFLMGLDTLTSNRLVLLSSVKTSSLVHKNSLNMLLKAYETIWDAVMDDRNRYEFRSTILVRSKDEVRTLIG
ncbi:hypothetical protein O181_064691 [Austropuccinia psidii MF-1]|uniref:Conserved oligomeric Golgi complex subunit 6 n=1 Tax=Austropuccinia psidii MF-1 TaxID=1389203 RepID=A0A9Q3EU68_9BASI|nr:hypothetical protein [Austropuccinia psidii MF-1]